MTRTTRPPALPAWLLKTFGSGPTVNALLGDLAQEYQRGRTNLWFWFQALIAIPISFAREVRANPWLTARAIVVGAVLLVALISSISKMRPYVDAAIDLYVPNHRPTLVVVHRVSEVNTSIGTPLYAAPAYLWSQMALLAIAGLLTGGGVSRLHREHRGAAVISLAIVLIVILNAGWVRVWLLDGVVVLSTWSKTLSLVPLVPIVLIIGVLAGGFVTGRGRQMRPLRGTP